MMSDQVGRNDPCPCGSGKKYKHCCLKDPKLFGFKSSLSPAQYEKKYGIRLKTDEQIAGIRTAGLLVVDLLNKVEELITPGTTTDQINDFVDSYTRSMGAIPAPLNYRGFPKSVCVSINEVICHGIPGDRVLKDGDIVNVDVTPILDGYYADGNKTFYCGQVSDEARRLVRVTRECLRRAVKVVRPGAKIGDIGYAIQQYATANRCSIVRDFVGHGVGLDFHERPDVPHYGRKGTGLMLMKGMTFTIEPMINLGRHHLCVLDDGWTAVTADGALSAQFEYTLVVTDDGCENLTPFDLGSE